MHIIFFLSTIDATMFCAGWSRRTPRRSKYGVPLSFGATSVLLLRVDLLLPRPQSRVHKAGIFASIQSEERESGICVHSQLSSPPSGWLALRAVLPHSFFPLLLSLPVYSCCVQHAAHRPLLSFSSLSIERRETFCSVKSTASSRAAGGEAEVVGDAK